MRLPKCIKILTIDWLESDFCLISTEDQLDQLVSRLKDPPDWLVMSWNNEGVVGRVNLGHCEIPFMVLRNRDYAVHESTHMAETILEHHGINPLAKNMSEVRAYMANYIHKLVVGALT